MVDIYHHFSGGYTIGVSSNMVKPNSRAITGSLTCKGNNKGGKELVRIFSLLRVERGIL